MIATADITGSEDLLILVCNFFLMLLHFFFHRVQYPVAEAIHHIADLQIPLPECKLTWNFSFTSCTSTNDAAFHLQ
jgi:hypothetical protein